LIGTVLIDLNKRQEENAFPPGLKLLRNSKAVLEQPKNEIAVEVLEDYPQKLTRSEKKGS